jgi:hypothetical protein
VKDVSAGGFVEGLTLHLAVVKETRKIGMIERGGDSDDPGRRPR